ncbi:hypothetical protein HHI36_015697 [Cryptolaemus montrouzieri]|uniref:Uncharacterized protein n=1 Tax=Cryptolaemus montrouzieri TaxID=559131 RepID=A0ABD2N6G2_9CUCU
MLYIKKYVLIHECNYVIGAIYRPQDYSIDMLMSKLDEQLDNHHLQKLSVQLTSTGNSFRILNKDIPTRASNENTGTLIDYAFTNSKLSSQLAIFHEYVGDHRHQMLMVDPKKRDSGACQNHCVVYDVDELTFQEKLVEMERRSWDNADDLCNEIIRYITTSLIRK